ncbi:hypothetical protein F383_06829 [Gossypium arboreum]|uniref:Uncharacterized protein n=1 Tax=Gossypium arboreum TaxID=29729 RepID=A0A0B0MFD1_GOSAR|nr:hypothetical protein F383_37225 [Gossypium arboreum]KHG18689.1 hypothetical protein F383_06829 [Gossypium arboreum]
MSWGGKLALQIAYFCPHGQRHGRVSQLCMTHCHVTRRVPPGIIIKMKLVCST